MTDTPPTGDDMTDYALGRMEKARAATLEAALRADRTLREDFDKHCRTVIHEATAALWRVRRLRDADVDRLRGLAAIREADWSRPILAPAPLRKEAR